MSSSEPGAKRLASRRAVLGCLALTAALTAGSGGLARATDTDHGQSTEVVATKGADHADSAVAQFLSYTRPDEFAVHRTADVLVPMRDGFHLTCDIYRPADANGSPADGRFAGIVMNQQAYGRTFLEVANDLRAFAAKGYNAIWCNTRGAQGVAGASPAPHSVALTWPWQAREQMDNYDLIEWFAAQSWATGDVGQIGTSYGAISTLQVAAAQQPPSLKAIIPIEGVTSMFHQFTYPGGIRTVGGTRGTFDDNCGLLFGEPTCSDRIPAEWDAHPTYDDYWAGQAIDPADIQVPTLYVTGLEDFFLDALNPIYAALGERDDFAMLLGPWEHGVPEYLPDNPISTGVYLAWFDRWLKQDKTAPIPPKVVAYEMPEASNNADQWRGLNAWPPSEAKPMRFSLLPDGDLRRGKVGHRGTDTYQVAADGSSGTVSYTTEPFKQDEVLTGSIDVTLTTTFSTTDGNIIVDLLDVGPDGSVTDLGPAGYLKASHRLSHSQRHPLEADKPYRLTLTIPSKFWAFQEGHRLRLTVSSADEIVAKDAPTGTVTISTGGKSSYVDLHTIKAMHH